jgi:hypothetical protein
VAADVGVVRLAPAAGVGMRTVRNVERNVAVGDGRGLSAEQQAILAKHRWERNFWAC